MEVWWTPSFSALALDGGRLRVRRSVAVLSVQDAPRPQPPRPSAPEARAPQAERTESLLLNAGLMLHAPDLKLWARSRDASGAKAVRPAVYAAGSIREPRSVSRSGNQPRARQRQLSARSACANATSRFLFCVFRAAAPDKPQLGPSPHQYWPRGHPAYRSAIPPPSRTRRHRTWVVGLAC